jgi:hypothetical protein
MRAHSLALILGLRHAASLQVEHHCLRKYNIQENRNKEYSTILDLIKNGTCVSSPKTNTIFFGASCPLDAALGLGIAGLPYSTAQEKAFHTRMDALPIKATPWLSFGRKLFDFEKYSRESNAAMFFYANQYVDFSLFSHFFAHPVVRNGVYLEIGGSNGLHASNTLFFEQHLNWTG